MTIMLPPQTIPLFDFLSPGVSPHPVGVEPPAAEEQWLAFVKAMSNGDPTAVGEAPHLGMFEMSVRRLCDLGYMRDPKRYRRGTKLVWSATWVNPHSLKLFLTSPKTQYQAFLRSIVQYAASPALPALAGCSVDGQKATLSGILAVAHKAGENGALSWFMDSKDREKFVLTTQAFASANGIF